MGEGYSDLQYKDLLLRLRAADLEALGELYVQTRGRLFAYALFLLQDEDAAKDLIQQLFIDFWDNKVFQQIHSGLVAYLMRSVHNRCLDTIKREQNRHRLRNGYFGVDKEPRFELTLLETRELGETLNSAIDMLPPMPARIFRLHYIEKLSYAEIAGQLNISSNTVSNHMTKALKKLREILKKQHSD